MNVLFFISIAVIIGFIGGKISNRFKFPGVVGYLFAGLMLGPSLFNIFSLKLLNDIGLFNDLALGLVAFIIGSEMRMSTFKKMGAGIITLIFAESFGAFLLVAGGVYLVTHTLYMALIFGAMAPASAPAGTAVVLQEYKAKGPLTNALYVVVGLDDGLAIMIYAFAAAFAKINLTGDTISFAQILQGPCTEIIGAIILGSIIGLFFGYALKKLHDKKEILVISVGAILLCTGLSEYFHVSLILSNLCIGMFSVNLLEHSNRKAYQAIQSITLPIFIIFFVIAGAHLQVSMLYSIGLIGFIYIIARTVGLVGGAYIGAVTTNQEPVIRKYLGFGILSQAGVAVGLAIMATRDFGVLGQSGQDLAVLVINTIAATTIIFEILGPIGTKYAITKAGEINKA